MTRDTGHMAVLKPQPDDGPTALIMAPTRELAIQLYNMVRLFLKPLELRAASVYGASPGHSKLTYLCQSTFPPSFF